MNENNFKLIEELGEVYREPTIKLDKLNDLLTYNINQDNVYDILIIADFYQYKRMEELIENIQLLILDGKIKIEFNKLNKEDLYNSICINECLREGEIKCNLEEKIHDVCCAKYLIEIKKYKGRYYYAINYAAKKGYIETIKYLESKGYKGDHDAINYAARNGHIEIIKYLENKEYKETEALNNAASNGHIEIIKHYENKGYDVSKLDLINIVVSKGYIEIIKYLESQGYNRNETIINYAAFYGQIEIIKYLENKGYKGTNPINNAAMNGHIEIVKYLIERKYNFTENTIIYAKTQEIKDILNVNIHLMIKK